MTECYRCGQEGHRRQDCPQAAPLPPGAPPEGRPPEPWRQPRHVPDPAIARDWAAAIREALGFPASGPEPARGRHAKENP